MSQASSTARTVFVRFVPPSSTVRRHHLEDLFSQIGPIKKSSVIVPHAKSGDKEEGQDATTATTTATATASSYGFVKYVAEEDAQKAAEKLDRSMLKLSADEKIQLRVERASDVAHNKKAKHHHGSSDHHAPGEEDAMSHKKTNRLILRNLSFYAKASHIRKALQSFGPIEDIHLPTVSDKNNDSKTKTFHRGFGFVTFVNAKDAQKCLRAKEIEIYKRKVQISKALHKAGYEKLKHTDEDARDSSSNKSKAERKEPRLQEEDPVPADDDDDDSSSSSDGSDSESCNEEEEAKGEGSDDDEDNKSSSDSEASDDDDQSGSGEESDNNDDDENNKDADAVREKRSLFLRNLPFDATRHDIFEAFRKYGRIASIYIVKDKQSGLPRGTAFLSFDTQGAAHRAMQASGSDSFATQRDVSEGKDDTRVKAENDTTDHVGISLRGRRIFVNIAVDRDTASTLTLDKQADRGKVVGKDRRNLYLKVEGRVDNDGENNLWDQLPEQDKLKRQKAWSEKNTKLKSPLFLISATRLSVRNIAKEIDERSLKKLCVNALQRGLQKKLVTAEDQIAQWRAAGEMTTREIIQKVDSLEHKDDIIPEFDETNIKKFIPSVIIERDFSSNSKNGAPSRGFGFVEFLHHTHALACLRELNNNTAYSEEYVSGGRNAVAQRGKRHKKKKRKVGEDGEVKVPRLIVEFSVENRAKAKKQAEYKAQQRANTIKQKIEHKEKLGDAEKKREKKKSRGARQRERKRKDKEEGTTEEGNVDKATPQKKAKLSQDHDDQERSTTKLISKATKPSKKRKVDKAEENLSKLVDSYEKSLVPAKAEPENKTKQRSRPEKRWFED